MGRFVPRHAPIAVAVLAAAVALVPAPVASAQNLEFAHDPAVETTSGFYPGDPPAGNPLAARRAGTYETFPLEVPDGTRHSSFTVRVGWLDARVNFDLYAYRLDARGVALGPAVAKAASPFRRASEIAVYAPASGTVEPGRYLVVVDNYCSRDADPDPRTAAPDAADCGIGEEIPEEDDFGGDVTLGNQPPTVSLRVPERSVAGEPVTVTADAEDPDGTIDAYSFDLDGDGTYEQDTDGIPRADATYPAAGTYTVGVEVLDDDGAVAVARASLVVVRAPRARIERDPIRSFRRNTTSFGGPRGRRLVITYRVYERSRVTVSLRRGPRMVRRIDAGVRRSSRSYRIVVKPTRLRKGRYTVRMSVLAASGKRQTAELNARRR
jgi:hypothetical protein